MGINVKTKGKMHNPFYFKAVIADPDSKNILYNVLIERTV